MFCPKCASQVLYGQRFCRNCGLQLDLIVDAIEGRGARGPLDFETLKRDLRDLGANLRAGFQEAGIAIKKTQKLNKITSPGSQVPQSVQVPNWSREFDKALRKVKAAHTRKYSLQQAALSIFSGGAMIAVWYQLLNIAANSGFLTSIENAILRQTGVPVIGLTPVIQSLWLLGLIPITRGVAHLINAIFFAPKKIVEPEERTAQAQGFVFSQPVYSTPVSEMPTGEPAGAASGKPQSSVTEDETLRFEPR